MKRTLPVSLHSHRLLELQGLELAPAEQRVAMAGVAEPVHDIEDDVVFLPDRAGFGILLGHLP